PTGPADQRGAMNKREPLTAAERAARRAALLAAMPPHAARNSPPHTVSDPVRRNERGEAIALPPGSGSRQSTCLSAAAYGYYWADYYYQADYRCGADYGSRNDYILSLKTE